MRTLISSVLKSDLPFLTDGLHHPVDEGSVHGNGIVDLHEHRHGRHTVIKMVKDIVGGLLEGLPQLSHDILQGHHQRQFRIIKNLQVLDQVLA